MRLGGLCLSLLMCVACSGEPATQVYEGNTNQDSIDTDAEDTGAVLSDTGNADTAGVVDTGDSGSSHGDTAADSDSGGNDTGAFDSYNGAWSGTFWLNAVAVDETETLFNGEVTDTCEGDVELAIDDEAVSPAHPVGGIASCAFVGILQLLTTDTFSGAVRGEFEEDGTLEGTVEVATEVGEFSTHWTGTIESGVLTGGFDDEVIYWYGDVGIDVAYEGGFSAERVDQ